jgi:hypothetical protein
MWPRMGQAVPPISVTCSKWYIRKASFVLGAQLLACLINLLPESFGAPSLCLSLPTTIYHFSYWQMLRWLILSLEDGWEGSHSFPVFTQNHRSWRSTNIEKHSKVFHNKESHLSILPHFLPKQLWSFLILKRVQKGNSPVFYSYFQMSLGTGPT